jgi:hypothetical protein
MDANDAKARDRDVATADKPAETTPGTTPETTPETTPQTTSEGLTAPLPAEQPVTAAFPTEPHVAEPVTALSAPPVEEVRYEPEVVTAAGSSAPLPVDDANTDAEGAQPRGPRMRTIVLGLVLLAISGIGLVRMLTNVRIDDTLMLLSLLVVAGALLLGGGVASAAREARGGRRRI